MRSSAAVSKPTTSARSVMSLGVVGALAVTALTTYPAAAQLAPQPWVTSEYAEITATDTVRMDVPNDGDSAFAYTPNLDFSVRAGDEVSFYMDTQQGTSCVGSYPSVYAEVDGSYFTSFDDGTPCPGDQTNTTDDGRVSFTIRETGRISYLVLQYEDGDGNGAGGVVELSDLRVNDVVIPFRDDPGGPDNPGPVPAATPYGAALSKNLNRCRVTTYTYHDAPLDGQVAEPRRRTFVTRVDGRVREITTVRFGREERTSLRVRPDSGKHIVTVRTVEGQVLDRMAIRTRRC